MCTTCAVKGKVTRTLVVRVLTVLVANLITGGLLCVVQYCLTRELLKACWINKVICCIVQSCAVERKRNGDLGRKKRRS